MVPFIIHIYIITPSRLLNLFQWTCLSPHSKNKNESAQFIVYNKKIKSTWQWKGELWRRNTNHLYSETRIGWFNYPSCWPSVCSSVVCKLWWRKTFFRLYVCKEIGPLGGCPNLPVKVECCRAKAAWSFGFSEDAGSPSVLAVGFRGFCPTVALKFWVTSEVRVS